ncbi:MAG: hypothetical protein AABX97_03835 [Candidatus Thermoplasmatota archaeon]
MPFRFDDDNLIAPDRDEIRPPRPNPELMDDRVASLAEQRIGSFHDVLFRRGA